MEQSLLKSDWTRYDSNLASKVWILCDNVIEETKIIFRNKNLKKKQNLELDFWGFLGF